MGVHSGSKRRRGAPAGGADLISGLGDDVVVRIIELLPDAGHAVRKGVLSRRWRGLWTRVSSLTFASSGRRELDASSDQRFLAFVNNALAQRATTDAALEHLATSFAVDEHATRRLVLRSAADAAQEWVRLRHAVRTTVKSFVLKLQLFSYNRREIRRGQGQQKPVMNLSELASSAKLETMHWKLKGVILQLPTASVFASLVDLTLECIEFAAGSGHLLARFLSSACCPSREKLKLSKFRLPKLNELLIEASALIELSVSGTGPTMEDSWTLKLKTPRLRYFRMQDDYANPETLEISAPRLEELFWPHQPYHIDVDGELPCVRSLKVGLVSHGYEEDDDINNGSICLLRCCTSLTSLEVSLHVDMV